MAMKGERFRIDLDSDEEPYRAAQPTALNLALISDIKERISFPDSKAPSPPRFKGSETGFPVHRIRAGPSKFKQGREDNAAHRGYQVENTDGSKPPTHQNANTAKSGGKDPSIHVENEQRLAQMSNEEIEEARSELMSGLSPSLIEKLLKKANIDDDLANPSSDLDPGPSMDSGLRGSTIKAETCGEPLSASTVPSGDRYQSPSFDPDGPPPRLPVGLQPGSQMTLPSTPKTHFPSPPKIPDLDPADPNFLSALHSTYFPSLPADPSAMAWMAPLDPDSTKDSAYAADEDALLPSELRFDFRGRLLPPRLSSQIPVTQGLHHHAHAPSSAGYTILELAHLARSTYPAQRCIAYQMLGRVLYRLGRGDFGLEEDVLTDGLWRLMDEGKVIQGLIEAAAKEDQGNRSVWITATEAVWLWRKGGGRKWRGR